MRRFLFSIRLYIHGNDFGYSFVWFYYRHELLISLSRFILTIPSHIALWAFISTLLFSILFYLGLLLRVGYSYAWIDHPCVFWMLCASINPNLWSVDVFRVKRYKLWHELHERLSDSCQEGIKHGCFVCLLFSLGLLRCYLYCCWLADVCRGLWHQDTTFISSHERLSGLIWVNGENVDQWDSLSPYVIELGLSSLVTWWTRTF